MGCSCSSILLHQFVQLSAVRDDPDKSGAPSASLPPVESHQSPASTANHQPTTPDLTTSNTPPPQPPQILPHSPISHPSQMSSNAQQTITLPMMPKPRTPSGANVRAQPGVTEAMRDRQARGRDPEVESEEEMEMYVFPGLLSYSRPHEYHYDIHFSCSLHSLSSVPPWLSPTLPKLQVKPDETPPPVTDSNQSTGRQHKRTWTSTDAAQVRQGELPRPGAEAHRGADTLRLGDATHALYK